MADTPMTDTWQPTACILCELNCGLEVKLGGEDGRSIVKLRGDKAHPGSRGYACEKAHQLDKYQNGRDRLKAPLRRKDDGSFEEIDWDTAISEIAAKLKAIRDEHGGEKIFYYGGGGQGNHLPGAYAVATLNALGVAFRSNALAQEKTGEFWVSGRMVGAPTRGDFEHCEVALFIGKNPWQSHGVPRSRVTLKEIARDPKRTMIVVDPRVSETAELADIHLQLKPGTDARLMAAIVAVLVQDNLTNKAWIEERTTGIDEVLPHFEKLPVAEYAERCGIEEARIREVAHLIAKAGSLAVYEDLGIQMNRHSTLVSYLNRLVWTLTGHFGTKGSQYIPAILYPLAFPLQNRQKRTPVVGAKIIAGLIPCNVITEEILTDHEDRYRAVIVESANPAHSLADSSRMREALRAVDLTVVIDVAMTETARQADYVLPVPTQYEKFEATFFNFEFPENYFHLRHPLFDPPPNVLPEPEIHARLAEALGAVPQDVVDDLKEALSQGRLQFAMAFMTATQTRPELMAIAPVLLYRVLGPTLPNGAASAAVLWGATQIAVMRLSDSIQRAGYEGDGPMLAEALFDAILKGDRGIVFARDDYDTSVGRIRIKGKRINLVIPELFDELDGLAEEPAKETDPDFPFILSAGERRSSTANTIYRHPGWRKKDRTGSLRICPADADRLGLADGSRARVVTKRGAAEVDIEVSTRMQAGHVSLPNGFGLDNQTDGEVGVTRTGVAPNDLTSVEDRDWLAGTPWHKRVPARIEVVERLPT